MQRRWKITLAGAGTAVAAAGLSVLLVLLLPGRPVARQRALLRGSACLARSACSAVMKMPKGSFPPLTA